LLTLLKFYADWCGPCKAMAPTVIQVVEELQDEVVLSEVNIDDNPQLRAEYGIRSIPSFVLLKGTEEVSRKIGSCSASELKDWITNESGNL